MDNSLRRAVQFLIFALILLAIALIVWLFYCKCVPRRGDFGPSGQAAGSGVPANPYLFEQMGGGAIRVFGPAPSSTRLAITSAVFSTQGDQDGFNSSLFQVSVDDCNGNFRRGVLEPLVPNESTLL